MEFYERVACDMGQICDESFISAIESACVTQAEYEREPDACHNRIRGALEESEDFI